MKKLWSVVAIFLIVICSYNVMACGEVNRSAPIGYMVHEIRNSGTRCSLQYFYFFEDYDEAEAWVEEREKTHHGRPEAPTTHTIHTLNRPPK